MRSFKVTDENLIKTKSASDGYQPKFLYNSYFLKSQAELGGYLVDDWKTEVLASRVAETLKIPVVHQEPCEIVYQGKHRNGVYSRNYNLDGFYDISFRRLLDKYHVDDSMFNRMNMIGKMNFLVEVLNMTGLSLDICKSYISDMLLLDVLVLNQDRHFSNFCVFTKNGQFCRALLFDNGMGMFENDTRFFNEENYKHCLDYSYSSPYGESLGYTLGVIKNSNIVKREKLYLLKELPRFKKASFPNDMAYYYFKDMVKELLSYV